MIIMCVERGQIDKGTAGQVVVDTYGVALKL